ncbi:iron-containing alcohol dehydrogenase, partial [bacterium]|nr:iron-containing alcohol dehydrogenase [bacterium]
MTVVFSKIEDISKSLADLSARRIFLVTGKGSFRSSGCERRLQPVLAGHQVQRFFDFEPNPRIEEVHRGVRLFRQFDPDTVIATGGGSVIDMAKIINLWAANDVSAGEFFDGSEPGAVKGFPLIAVPTTAGSGSEATSF